MSLLNSIYLVRTLHELINYKFNVNICVLISYLQFKQYIRKIYYYYLPSIIQIHYYISTKHAQFLNDNF